MSHSKGKPSNTVFVRNIPFEFTEEQLIDVFKEVGPVISFKLVFDKETGRPKGFGFCQYYDIDTASSAVRNLNGYELGGRTIHVVFADPHASGGGGGYADMGSKSTGGPGEGDRYRDTHALGPSMGSAKANRVVSYRTVARTNPKITAVDAISQTLASMSQDQLQELIAHVQKLIHTGPDQARALLSKNPQLTYALFQTMLMLQLIGPDDVKDIMQTQITQATAPQANFPPAQPAPADNVLQQQQAALAQLLNLTPEQIQQLPPEQQQQINQLKSQVAALQGQSM